MKLTDELCNELFAQFPIEVKRAIILIEASYREAVEKHPHWPNNVIEGAAILGEESGELLQAALQFKYEKGAFYNMHNEAIQCGAMAIRFLVNYSINPIRSKIEKFRKS